MIDTLAIDLGIEPEYERRLMDSAKKLGWKVIVPRRIPFTEELLDVTPAQLANPNTWYHGDIATAKAVAKHTPWQVHAPWNDLDLLNFSYEFPWMMFNNYQKSYLDDFEDHPDRWFKSLGVDGMIFVKSSAADKTVSGRLISQENFVKDWELMTFYKPPKNTILAITSPKLIKSEARFLIVDRKIITGSYYRVGGQAMYLKVPETSPAWTSARLLLRALLFKGYNPAPSWVLDLAEDHDGNWSVMEVGATSCCGFYACDTDKFCEALNALN